MGDWRTHGPIVRMIWRRSGSSQLKMFMRRAAAASSSPPLMKKMWANLASFARMSGFSWGEK